ncbi:MAG: thermonuclease family protein [Miltoncostaeaceae bacterium]
MRLPHVRSVFLGLAAVVVAAGCADDSAGGGEVAPLGPGATVEAEVDRVVDGDTVDVALTGGDVVRVRLLGIDTPEAAIPDEPPECFGPEATRRARQLLPEGARIELLTDPRGEDVDDFGRVLAYVDRDGRSVNRALILSGHAEVFAFRDRRFQRRGDFEEAERQARRERRGLWAACDIRSR